MTHSQTATNKQKLGVRFQMAEKSTRFFQGIKYVPNLEELDQEKQPMKIDEKSANEKHAIEENLSISDFCKFLPIEPQKKNVEIPYSIPYSKSGSEESYDHRHNNDHL